MNKEYRYVSKFEKLCVKASNSRELLTSVGVEETSILGELLDVRAECVLWLNNLETDSKYSGN
jgi:hypothetical protein